MDDRIESSYTSFLNKFYIYTKTNEKRKEHHFMNSSKDTSSKQQGKSSTVDNNLSDKNVTHTQNLPPKTKSNSASNSVSNDYKYIPGADRAKSSASENK
jgi:hypothetical protein